MEHRNSTSEVTRLLTQIEVEYLAATRGLSGLAITARHAFITTRMENLGRLHESLRAVVGEGAIKLLVERLESISAE